MSHRKIYFKVFTAAKLFSESNPTCEPALSMEVIEGEMIEVNCSFTFGGRWIPTMTMVDAAGNSLETEDLSELQLDATQQPKSGTVVHALRKEASSDMVELMINVSTKFEGSPPEPLAAADNIASRANSSSVAENIPPWSHNLQLEITVLRIK